MMQALAHATTHAFAGALLDSARAVPAGLVAWNGSDPGLRFAVHRNNVRVSLVAALADTFPVVRELVGEEFFTAMACRYVADEPPRSPVLAHYGEGFADWVRSFAPAAGLPCLADLARLERARVRAYHAADTPTLGTDRIAALCADTALLPQARLDFHPSVSVLVSSHAIVSLWAAHQGRERLQAVQRDRAEAALVLRIDDDVVVLRIPLAAADFYRRLQKGQSLGEAASVNDVGFDLSESLATLIRHGALSAWHSPE